MKNKDKYLEFVETVYVPIYSQPWWLDAICLPENWDVWIYDPDGVVCAAMPYYIEYRNGYKYITKAPLTQNNGIVFKYPEGAGNIAKRAFEEKVINEACCFIESLELGVYEQQFHYSFKVYLPFFWNGYVAIPRYTYVIDKSISKDEAWKNMSTNYRKNCKKGKKNGIVNYDMEEDDFYSYHERVFSKQGLACPFSKELWKRLYKACCIERNCGKILCSLSDAGEVQSILFLVWDKESMYHLLGGNMPGFQTLETYSALTWEGICVSRDMNLHYDFEGSMIKRISKSFREYGGIPMLYFRIRKVFKNEILRNEFENSLINREK